MNEIKIGESGFILLKYDEESNPILESKATVLNCNDMSKWYKDVFRSVSMMMLQDKPSEEIFTYYIDAVSSLINGEVPIEELSYRKESDKNKVYISAHYFF